MSDAISNLINDLQYLDQGDPVKSATIREKAQNLLANPKIALKIRTMIADLLIQANQALMLKAVTGEESY
ncbi:conserved hypothetical protein [Rippkaea orientalis PCC 8801]|uniref:Uncharacterized protein n=1 Tax=Rippkaea orientalis (strain PCC 8801 / RF-1) TaxID=41431 RepID=B7JVQ2_RIPO1|nr:hypothetical protein [Rippkaea orientalis]ACK64623.1 conserved hypothetical protein [Rippkaea orientalis PCC 8801]